jgi:hypothetical protein
LEIATTEKAMSRFELEELVLWLGFLSYLDGDEGDGYGCGSGTGWGELPAIDEDP